MPEGDSIHNLALRLRPVLVGKQVRAFEAHTIDDARAATVVGHAVESIEARGKNLLIRFDDGRTLHIHLRMMGRLRFERPRSSFWKPRTTRPQLRLAVDGAAIVGARIPVLRLLEAGKEERAPDIAGLGPDILTEDFDLEEAVRRLMGLGKMEIGEALLLQRAVAGIGNIYKSETLFGERTNPRAPTAKLGAEKLRAIVKRASVLMRRNLGRTSRVRFQVYDRAGKPCRVCGTPIERFRQGAPPGRSTYHCPQCQAASPISSAR